ncbi:MAG: SdpI family protein [Clostridia bacterium]|nr:SdpI family protein [Clostridia bacterium]
MDNRPERRIIMIKNNKIKIIISSIIILLPIIAGLILWQSIPDKIAVHWNINNEADNYAGKYFAVFGLPLIILGIHLLCILGTALDKRNKDQNKKVFGLVFWISPCVSLFGGLVIYSHALGKALDVGLLTLILLGLMFIIVGNYLPKCKKNYTIGIKLPWTVNNEAVWNKTHRFGGIIWVIGGILMLITAFLPGNIMPIMLIAVLVLILVIPTVYSYVIYRNLRR